MSSTSINVHISDSDHFEFRQRALSSCHSVLLNIGQTEIAFFIHNQDQYDKMVDSLQNLIQELAPGRSLMTQEEAACAGDAESRESAVFTEKYCGPGDTRLESR